MTRQSNPPFISPELLARITKQYGTPRIETLPEATLGGDQSACFEQLRRRVLGANVVVFPAITIDHVDQFFHLRLTQVLRWERPLPALSVVELSPGPGSRRLAGGFADRFRSGWPFAACVFVAQAENATRLSAALGLRVHGYDDTWTPARPDAQGHQQIALQLQPLLRRTGSTTGFENQIESLVQAGFLTIRVFTDATERRGATLDARLEGIIAENSDNAGAHINALGLPDGPPVALPRTRDQERAWATSLAEFAACRVRDPRLTEAANRAGFVVANYLHNIGPALSLAPRARILLDIRDDRARGTRELMLQEGRSEAEIEVAEASVARIQARILAIPDVCGHVSRSEFERLGPLSQRSAVLLPHAYSRPVPETASTRFDVLIFGDEHRLNIASVHWFIDQVWHPYLEAAGVSLAIAGRIGNHIPRAGTSPLLHVLGFVEDIDATRTECRLTVVPDRAGTGTANKTLTTLAAGHPLVTTRVGLRGLDASISGMLPSYDDPQGMAADILTLLRDPACMAERRRLVQEAHAAIRRGPDHATVLRSVPRPTRRARAERQARWANIIMNATKSGEDPLYFDKGTIFLMSGGPWDRQVLLDGWHWPEPWGRWTDGAEASLRIALGAPAMEQLTLQLELVPSPFGAVLALRIDDTSFPPIKVVQGTHAWDIPLQATRGKSTFEATLRVGATFRPAHTGNSSDTRILGIGVSSVRIRPTAT